MPAVVQAVCCHPQVAWAQVAPAALGQRHFGLDAVELQVQRNVPLHQLLLQCHGGGGDQQLLLLEARHFDAGNEVGHRLAGAGGRLDDGHPAGTAERPGDLCDHLSLRRACAKAGQAIFQASIGGADGVFGDVGEHGGRNLWRGLCMKHGHACRVAGCVGAWAAACRSAARLDAERGVYRYCVSDRLSPGA